MEGRKSSTPSGRCAVNRAERKRAQAAARAYDQRIERDRFIAGRPAKRPGSPAHPFTALVHERIEQLIRTDGDFCSLCRGRFQHNHRSYGGVTSNGVIALVSECCASKLEIVLTSGLYTSRPYDEQLNSGSGPIEELSLGQIEEAITAHQQRFAAIDELTDAAARRAGVPHMAEKMTMRFDDDDVSWKANDRDWFERNTMRSHRLRPLFPGEPSNGCDKATPPGHELAILVRQVAPGQRVRLGFYRSTEVEIPDDEAILHALFDSMAEGKGPISVAGLVELARKYECIEVVS